MSEFEAAEAAVQAALDAGAVYADARVMHRRTEAMSARNGEVESLTQDASSGVGVRALVGSGWGFFAAPDLGDRAVRDAGARAAEIASASALVGRDASRLLPSEPVTGSWASECEQDPFEVSLADKGDLLVRATGTMSENGADLSEAQYQIWDTEKWFVSSEGHRVDQHIRESGAGIMATAIGEHETQRRSYPAARGQYATLGWEFVESLDLEGNAARVGSEARELLSAPLCPSGETTLILGAEQLALQIHESVGHAIELDRILGWEAAYAGTSWLDLGQLGSLKYGSELMNISIDPSIPGALGSFGYDDEGTPATKRDAVREGIWVGVLAGRDSASVAGLDYAGSVRSDGWARLPMVRMTNVGLEPGPHTFEQIVADTDDGIFMETNRSWSIDDRRLNFQFGTEVGYEVKNGELRPAAPQPDVHRDRAAVLVLDGHARRRRRRLGHAQLRQGPTRPDRPHRAPGGAGPVPQRAGGGAGMTASLEQDLAARAVELVGRALPGAEVSAAADRHRLSLTRFANSVIHQNVARGRTSVSLNVHHDGRTAGGSATVARGRGPVARSSTGWRAPYASAPQDPTWPGLADPHPPAATEVVDPATAAATPADRAPVVEAFVDGAGGLEAAGYCRTNHWTGAFADSSGQQVTAEAVECGLAGIARDRAPTAWRARRRSRIGDLDGTALGARAAAKARAWADPQDLAPGRYEVVLESNAVSDVLGNLAAAGFNGRAVNEGRSFVRLGEDAFDASVSIVDDPLAMGLAYDGEGTPRRRLILVDGGRTVALTHDRRSAAEAGRDPPAPGTTRSRTPSPTDPRRATSDCSRPVPRTASPGEVEGPAADSAVAELVAGVERGILVSDFWYTRILDPRTLAITGLTRNGVWLIEDGEVTTPLRNFRFTQAYSQALAPGNVAATGRTAEPIPGDTYTTTSPRWSCPALHLRSWNFTGGSAG